MDNPMKNLGTPKDIFLESIRDCLGKTEGHPLDQRTNLMQSTDELKQLSSDLRINLNQHLDSLADDLSVSAVARGWNVHKPANVEGILEHISEIAKKWGITDISRSDQEVFSEYVIDSGISDLGCNITTIAQNDSPEDRTRLREAIISSGIGITGADYAVAETGSIVILPRKGLSRLVSVVPAVHIALVRKRDILRSLDDVFLLRRLDYHQEDDMGSYLNFITGPSRTADIEQTIVIGVHGPKEVHMLLLD